MVSQATIAFTGFTALLCYTTNVSKRRLLSPSSPLPSPLSPDPHPFDSDTSHSRITSTTSGIILSNSTSLHLALSPPRNAHSTPRSSPLPPTPSPLDQRPIHRCALLSVIIACPPCRSSTSHHWLASPASLSTSPGLLHLQLRSTAACCQQHSRYQLKVIG